MIRGIAVFLVVLALGLGLLLATPQGAMADDSGVDGTMGSTLSTSNSDFGTAASPSESSQAGSNDIGSIFSGTKFGKALKVIGEHLDPVAHAVKAAYLWSQGRDEEAGKEAVKAIVHLLIEIAAKSLAAACAAALAETLVGPVACFALSDTASAAMESAADEVIDHYHSPPKPGGGTVAEVAAPACSGGGGQIDANAQSVINSAESGGVAITRLGASGCGSANIAAQVNGSITTLATGANGRTDVGTSSGNANLNVSVGGDVTTIANGQSTSTLIGTSESGSVVPATGTVAVTGSVFNQGGNLAIGGAGVCVAYRNNQCCVTIHQNYCVLNFYPKPPNYPCPPRYVYDVGMCFLYSDTLATITGFGSGW